MPTIKLNDIIVLPDRHRKNFSDDKLNSLAESIKEFGLIEPIILNQRNELVAGERRMKAHQLLGLEEIKFDYLETLDDWHYNALQLEENLQREDLTWQEAVAAKAQLHELYQARHGGTSQGKRDGGWGLKDTAEMLGESLGSTAMDIQLAKAILANPDLGKKETKAAAYKAMTVLTDHAFKKDLAELLAMITKEKGESPIQIINGDSTILLPNYPDESFDFSITDPPYGIGLHDMQDTFPNRGEVRQGVEFDDAKSILEGVVKPVTKELYRILKEGAHLYFFFGIARYTQVRELLEEAGFWVNPCPIFWIKNNALNLRPWLTFPVNYEPCFQCSKGYPPRPFTQPQKLSTFDHPILSGNKVHPTEKPLPMIKWLIDICSQPKERGIDPFLGGGTFTLALKEMDRLGVGIELDSVWHLEAMNRFEEEKGGEHR